MLLFLGSLHTLFVREHNRICDLLIAENFKYKSDEILYQMARKILIGEYQNIVFGEFLPAIIGNQDLQELTLSIGKSNF